MQVNRSTFNILIYLLSTLLLILPTFFQKSRFKVPLKYLYLLNPSWFKLTKLN